MCGVRSGETRAKFHQCLIKYSTVHAIPDHILVLYGGIFARSVCTLMRDLLTFLLGEFECRVSALAGIQPIR